uniref:hypothetical protein n=1 Tax=Parabacteroides goldsteinii TaxID=328812 RepID=UPI00241E11B0
FQIYTYIFIGIFNTANVNASKGKSLNSLISLTPLFHFLHFGSDKEFCAYVSEIQLIIFVFSFFSLQFIPFFIKVSDALLLLEYGYSVILGKHNMKNG